MRTPHRALLSLTTGLLLAMVGLQCAATSFPVVRPAYRPDRDDIAQLRAEEYFVKARDYDRRGLDQMAEHFYELAYELDPASDILRDLLAEKYISSGKYTRALLLVKGQHGVDTLPARHRRTVALIYLKMGQFAKAAEVLRGLPDLSRDEQRTLAMVYESMGETARAIEAYTSVYDSGDATLELGMKIAELYARREDFSAAESVYVMLDSTFGRQPELFQALGTLRLHRADTTGALNYFRSALLVDSTYLEAKQQIARIHIERENYDDAIKYYEQLHAADDRWNLYGRTLALLYYYKDDYDRAEDLLTSFLSQNSDDYELHFYLGLVFVARKQYELAEMEIEKALALRPDFVQAWQNLCYLAIRQEQWAKALDRARRFVAAVEDNADAWRTLGYVQGMQKKLPRALSSLKRAVALDSTDAQAWFELGSVLERMERYDAAADAFRRVLRLNPDDHAAANYLGYMWAEQGVKLDSARTLLEFALDKDPENGAYLDSYAWIFYKKGDYANAHIYLLKALLHIDDDPVIYAHLGDVMAARGNIDDAVKAYRRSIELGSEEREHLESRIEDLLNRKDGSFADSPESP